MKYIGAHVSIGGGVENSPLNAAKINATAFALFTKNQRQWVAADLKEESIIKFKENVKELGFGENQILAHDSYLINLGNSNIEKREQSITAFKDEMFRCKLLGIKYLNFHPGSHLKEISEIECLKLIANSVREVLNEVPDVTAVIENTAGQGSNVGYSFEHLAQLIELIDNPTRVGVCIDTCHAYAAGYDLEDNFDWCFKEFERLIGFEFLKGMHLNDSKSKLAGHLDRHHSLGQGELGLPVFKRIMQDSRFDNMPLILETIDDTIWKDEIELLNSFVIE